MSSILMLPPLRSMGRDLLKIAENLLKRYNEDLGRSSEGFTPEATEKAHRA